MPLYLVPVVTEQIMGEDGLEAISRAPAVPQGLNWTAVYNADLSQAVVRTKEPVAGKTALTAGQEVGFSYADLIDFVSVADQ